MKRNFDLLFEASTIILVVVLTSAAVHAEEFKEFSSPTLSSPCRSSCG
jgi:hypothetical protein